MYMMSMMAWLAAPDCADLNKEKCIKIALVHDLAECIVGDIAPSDNISKEDKAKLEAEAMNQLRSILGASPIADEFVALWSEYENATTPEAVLVKQIDKLEMVIQAFIYEQCQEIDLSDFYSSVSDKITNPVLYSWFVELAERRLKQLPHLTPVSIASKPETLNKKESTVR